MEIMEPLLSKIRVGKLKHKEDATSMTMETVNSTAATNETTTGEPLVVVSTTVKLEPKENSTQSAVTSADQITEKPKESLTTVAP